jgi:hypothetical protein
MCELKWTQPSIFSSRYELRSGDTVVGALNVHGLFRPSATGQSQDSAWTFEPEAARRGSIVVRARDSFHELAVFEIGASDRGGLLRFGDGRALTFTSDFWKGRAEFQTLSGDPLIRFRTHGMLRLSATVQILARARQMSELSWLAMLGWFLIVGYL